MKTAKFARKPFDVDAVQVTAENIEEVAKWCQGDVVDNSTDDVHIKVRVLRVLNERQTKAFVGDWVLYAGTGYKVYTNKAFRSSFEPLDGVAKDKAVQEAKGSPEFRSATA
jgi:hypothetical protein